MVLHGTYFFRIRPDYRLEYLRHEYDYCKTLFLIYSGASAVYFVTNFETIKSNKKKEIQEEIGRVNQAIAEADGIDSRWTSVLRSRSPALALRA